VVKCRFTPAADAPLRSLLKKVSDSAELPVLTRSANRESISYGDGYDAGGGAERFFNKL
jgi:hypothetical protein